MSYKSDDDTNQNQYNKRSQNKSKTQQKVSKKDKFDEKVKSAAVQALKEKFQKALKTELDVS